MANGKFEVKELKELIKNQNNVLKIKVSTGQAKNEIVGLMSDEKTLKIKIKAEPINNQANFEIISYLAKLLKIPTSQIKILSGSKTTQKTVKIENDLSQ